MFWALKSADLIIHTPRTQISKGRKF